MTRTFRLIIDPPRAATLNMAVDETLMLSQGEGGAPVLRFYGWEAPSVTTGYFQDIERVAEKFNAEKKGVPVVRRLSGGGAVLHGEDLTFSLCLPLPSPYFPSDVKSSYLKINEAVRLGLQAVYPEMDYADCRQPAGRQGTVPSAKSQSREKACFEVPVCYDLLRRGKKVLGASQRRIEKSLLHQAALFLERDREFLTARILEGFEKAWKVTFEEAPLTAGELRRAREIEEKRYSSPEWALFRDLSFLS